MEQDLVALRAELARLQAHNDALVKQSSSVEIYKEDRRLLIQQVGELKDRVDFLEDENAQLKDENARLREANRAKSVEGATTTTAPVVELSAEAMKHQRFQEKYRLPNTEYPITYFSCAFIRKRDRGNLYITPNYLLFVPSSLWGEPFTIALKDIMALRIPKDHEHSIDIDHRNGSSYLFRAFVSRADCEKAIQAQAFKIGNTRV